MHATVENILAGMAALPGLYGFVCWIRRSVNAQKAAGWVKARHRDEWSKLHWLARRNPWAAVEVLISKGLISGAELDEYRARDEYLEKATWVGLFISALLLFIIAMFKYIASALA